MVERLAAVYYKVRWHNLTLHLIKVKTDAKTSRRMFKICSRTLSMWPQVFRKMEDYVGQICHDEWNSASDTCIAQR